MKYNSLISETRIEDPEKDFKDGQKLSRYVFGERALYIPKGFSWDYIPYSAITRVESRTQNYAAKGCCGSGVEKLPVLLIEYASGKQVLQCDSPEDAEKAEGIVSGRA